MDCWITKTIGSCSPGSCVCRPLWFKKKKVVQKTPIMTILHCMHHGFTLSMSSLVFTYGIWYFNKNKNLCHCAFFYFLFFCSHSATLCVSLKKKIVIVVLFCLLQPYVWTGPSISMCSPLMETAIERPSMCIWTYVMMTTFKATQRNKF